MRTHVLLAALLVAKVTAQMPAIGQPATVPVPQPECLTCGTYDCQPGYHCAMVDNAACDRAAPSSCCPQVPRCEKESQPIGQPATVPVPQAECLTCGTVDCQPGYHCAMVDAVCDLAPGARCCPKVPRCEKERTEPQPVGLPVEPQPVGLPATVPVPQAECLTCGTYDCQPGYHCAMVDAVCDLAPGARCCPKVPRCEKERTENLVRGSVCKTSVMDRSKDCPRKTVCKPKRGDQQAGEAEGVHSCQRQAKKLRKWFLKTKKNVKRADAIARAQDFVQEMLKLLKERSAGKEIIRVALKYVCSLPSSRADRGITEADRKAPSICTAVDAEAAEDENEAATPSATGKGRSMRPLADGENVVTVMDLSFETTGEEEGERLAEDVKYVTDKSRDAGVMPIAIDMGREAGVTEGPVGSPDEGKGFPIAAIIGAVAAVLAVSGCGIVAVLRQKSRQIILEAVDIPVEFDDVSFRKVPQCPAAVMQL